MILTEFQQKKVDKYKAIRADYERIMQEEGGNPTAIYEVLSKKYGYHPIHIGKIIREGKGNKK